MAKKFKLYPANKINKAIKYNKKLQDHYNERHAAHPDEPWIIACIVPRYDGKLACTMIDSESCPANDGDDGDVDTLEPEQLPEEK
jgi:hypothetical protein